MANRDNNPATGRNAGSGSNPERSGDPQGDNSEWLRDQTGEDHNLSGSDTYRTLPDQPEGDQDEGQQDASDRQSNR